jgi:hypothetical protein
MHKIQRSKYRNILILIAQSQLLVHVVAFNRSPIYIVQYFMFLRWHGDIICLNVVDTCRGPHVGCVWICPNMHW